MFENKNFTWRDLTLNIKVWKTKFTLRNTCQFLWNCQIWHYQITKCFSNRNHTNKNINQQNIKFILLIAYFIWADWWVSAPSVWWYWDTAETELWESVNVARHGDTGPGTVQIRREKCFTWIFVFFTFSPLITRNMSPIFRMNWMNEDYCSLWHQFRFIYTWYCQFCHQFISSGKLHPF